MQNKWYNFDGNKLIYHMDRVYNHYRDGKRIYPLHMDLGITKKCNLKCVYCYGIYQKMTGEVVKREALMDVFGTAPDLGVRSITITGDGEPTLNPALYDAISLGKSKGLDIGVATNGVALDDHKIEVLLNSCTWLRINLSAVSRDSYKSIMGVDLWGKVQANIHSIMDIKKKIKSNCTVGIQMVLIPDALPEIIPESLFAIANGIDYFVIKQFSNPGCKEMSQFSLDWYNKPKVIKTLKLAESMSTTHTKIVPKWKMMQLKGGKKYDHCPDCPLLVQLSGSGKLYPCGFLFGDDRYCYGDLHKQTLKEVLDSDHYWNLIHYLRYEFDNTKQCKGCCRHDSTNEFIHKFLNPPEHLNFI